MAVPDPPLPGFLRATQQPPLCPGAGCSWPSIKPHPTHPEAEQMKHGQHWLLCRSWLQRGPRAGWQALCIFLPECPGPQACLLQGLAQLLGRVLHNDLSDLHCTSSQAVRGIKNPSAAHPHPQGGWATESGCPEASEFMKSRGWECTARVENASSEVRRPVSDRVQPALSGKPRARASPFTWTKLTACTRPTLFSAQQT